MKSARIVCQELSPAPWFYRWLPRKQQCQFRCRYRPYRLYEQLDGVWVMLFANEAELELAMWQEVLEELRQELRTMGVGVYAAPQAVSFAGMERSDGKRLSALLAMQTLGQNIREAVIALGDLAEYLPLVLAGIGHNMMRVSLYEKGEGAEPSRQAALVPQIAEAVMEEFGLVLEVVTRANHATLKAADALVVLGEEGTRFAHVLKQDARLYTVGAPLCMQDCLQKRQDICVCVNHESCDGIQQEMKAYCALEEMRALWGEWVDLQAAQHALLAWEKWQ